MYSHLIVLSEAVAGRDDDFNDWYTWVHIRDVMRLSPVGIAVQRFKRSAQQLAGGASGRYPQPYLGIYENTDPPRFSADHKWVFTDEMPISTAISEHNVCEAYYDTLIARNKAPGQFPKTDVIVERFETGAGGDDFADWYAGTRFTALMQLPGMVSGFVGKAGKHQMIDHMAHPGYTCVYRTTDLAATLKAWVPCNSPVALKPDEISVDCYTPLIARLTAMEVREPDPDSAETARRKRAKMGDDVQKSAPAQFKWDSALAKNN